jgi:cytochrome P450
MKTLPPGPKEKYFNDFSNSLKNRPLEFLTELKESYGNIVPFKIGMAPIVLLSDPELIQIVLVSEASNYVKDIALKNNRAFFGQGLLSSEGEYWKRQRKLAAPSFSPKRLEEYAQVMTDHASLLIKRWKGNVANGINQVDIQHDMMVLTLGIATKTLFDVDLSHGNQELEDALTAAQKHLNERMNDPLLLLMPEWVPFPTNINLLKAIKTIDHFLYKLIEERRGHTDGRRDLLSILLNVQDDTDGSGMTDKQIRDELFTMFFAGHETTALTLTWTLYLISQHPHVEATLLNEVKQLLNGRQPQASDYFQLSYTEKVIKESMRIRPPVWAIAREAARDCQLGGHAIAKGTAFIMSQWVMHHDQRYFKDADKFDPDRWTEEFTESLPKFAYFPFGGGPRTCIGNTFAMLEAVLMLASIIQEFRLSLVPNHPVELMPAVTLRAKHGIRMTLEARNPNP